jgi:hypothetical protein
VLPIAFFCVGARIFKATANSPKTFQIRVKFVKCTCSNNGISIALVVYLLLQRFSKAFASFFLLLVYPNLSCIIKNNFNFEYLESYGAYFPFQWFFCHRYIITECYHCIFIGSCSPEFSKGTRLPKTALPLADGLE